MSTSQNGNGHQVTRYQSPAQLPVSNALARLMDNAAEPHQGVGLGNYFRQGRTHSLARRVIENNYAGRDLITSYNDLEAEPLRGELQRGKIMNEIRQEAIRGAELEARMDELTPNTPESWERARHQAQLDELGKSAVTLSVEKQKARAFIRHLKFRKLYERKLRKANVPEEMIQRELAECDRLHYERRV